MIGNDQVLDEGFTPLKKSPTEPKRMSFKSASHITSFKSEEAAQMWEGSTWNKFEKSRGKFMDRSNSFIGSRSRTSTSAAWDSPVAALIQQGLIIDYCATIQYNDRAGDVDTATNECMAAIQALPFPIIAVIPGGETGVELADRLSNRMGLRTNGETASLARRNKFYMGEAVRNAGVRAVKQHACKTSLHLHTFLNTLPTEPSFRCVVKPVQSAGTDDVFLCTSKEEAEVAFNRILGKVNGLGQINESVLVQEFLVGKEYVVDKVSRDGVHKVVAIWEYDKRPVNGANFVYYGMRLMPSTTEKSQQMIAYADKVLDALGIKEGPSHMEIMYNDASGPCLVEVGCRCQGGEGTWLASAMECVGFTQVSVTLDAFLDGKFFATLDKDNYVLKKAAREVDMVSRMGGVVRSTPGEEVIRKLPSFRSMSWDIKPGDYQSKTIDCFTRPGCVQLVHESEEQAERDFEAIHELDKCGLLDFSVICPTPPVTGAVVVVDPFSSGAHLAAMVIKWGFKLILVFSEMDSPVASLVSQGSNNFKPTLLIQHDATNPNQDAAVEETMAQLRNQDAPVLAILAGTETGVELCEMLSARFGTRSNGEEMTFARRNKYAMQEAIRAVGMRAVKQQLCHSEEDCRAFLKTIVHPTTGRLKCVVKPNESAGTDSVFLCTTVDEVLAGFRLINGHCNGLGHENFGALCQEFLTGTEFVIDGVSRDGVFKVTAIWEYDKRSVNGANFVYFGMFLRGAETSREQALIAYAKQVVDALGIQHGPSHMEVMYDETTGPCLVEVGSRCHGGEGTWLPVVNECLGYSQLDATLSAYIRPDRFDALPFEPMPLKQGAEAFLVSHKHGILKDIPGSDEIRSMASFRRMELLTQPGATIAPTIDCFTRPGSVQLVNATIAGMQADYQRIRELEHDGLFEYM